MTAAQRNAPTSFLATAAAALLLIAACSTTTPGTAAEATAALVGTSTAPPAVTSNSAPLSAATYTMTMSVTGTLANPESPTPVTDTPMNPETPTSVATTPEPSTPAVPPTDLAGEVYGFITAVDLATSQITLDKVDWFTGAAAQQACAEDGVTAIDNNRCTGYYYRNVNPTLRVVAVTPQAAISTLDGSRSVPSDLATVARRISGTTGSTYHLVVTDGVITDLEEMYRP